MTCRTFSGYLVNPNMLPVEIEAGSPFFLFEPEGEGDALLSPLSGVAVAEGNADSSGVGVGEGCEPFFFFRAEPEEGVGSDSVFLALLVVELLRCFRGEGVGVGTNILR